MKSEEAYGTVRWQVQKLVLVPYLRIHACATTVHVYEMAPRRARRNCSGLPDRA